MAKKKIKYSGQAREKIMWDVDMDERRPWITLGCFTYLMVPERDWKHRYGSQGI